MGSSIGIAATAALLTSNTQVSHADLAQHVTYDRLPIDPSIVSILGIYGDGVMAMLNAEVNRQAAFIAYLDDFKLMMIATLLAMPLILFLRKSKPQAPGDETPVIAE
jgi:DHA2 family multidrug resistance protein